MSSEGKFSLAVPEGEAHYVRAYRGGYRPRALEGMPRNYVPLIEVPDSATVEDVIHAFRTIRRKEYEKVQSRLLSNYVKERRRADDVEEAGRRLDAVDSIIRKIT